MESLRATYRDDDDEDDSEFKDAIDDTQTHLPLSPSQPQLQQHPQQNTYSNSPSDENNNNNDSNSANGSKQEEFEDAEENGNNEDDEDDDGDDADEEEDDPQLPKPEQPPNLPNQPSSDETDDEDDNVAPARKKQKPLAAFTSPSPFPATPAASLPSAAAAAAATARKAAKKPKKKTKAVNVWTKSTSRKGKKKTKPATTTNQESTVLITPTPRFPDRSDDSPDMKICLSKVYKAERVELSDDRLSAGSTKGYRMVRATRGVSEGAWYFEIKVVKLGETGHTRLGWSMEKGDLQASIGYDGNSFGYRDMDGSKVHRAVREKYGEGYFEGDVVGFYINLPDGGLYKPKPTHFAWYKGNKFAYPADGKEDPPKVVPGSEMSFFKNGVCQGVAYDDLYGGHYYPAASMYTLPNQPNCVVKFNFGPDFEFFPEDFGGRPIPTPMIEVPYHGYDGRVEGIVQNGLSAEKKH